MKVVVLSFDDPWVKADGGTLRTRHLLEAFARLGHETLCLCLSPAQADPKAIVGAGFEIVRVSGSVLAEQDGPNRLGALKREFLPMPTSVGARHRGLEVALGALGPVDLLVVSQLRGVRYLDQAAGDPKLWLDQADVWSVFAEAEIAARRGIPRMTAKIQQTLIRRAEGRAARRAAVVTAAGWSDAQSLNAATKTAVVWLPTPSAAEEVERLPGEQPTAGLFANFNFWPNRQAYETLLSAWLPGLREAGWHVLAAGLGSEHLPRVDGVEVLGPVGHTADFYRRVDVSLAPLGLGGGIKVKLVEALMAGRPIAATSYALDGFSPELRDVVRPMPIDHWEQAVHLHNVQLQRLATSRARRAFAPAEFVSRVGEASRTNV